ncbi:hypothetical protein BD410DRAFT_391565 [Rickenella mellea]|uniref:F-box domain-containing protein n=1 Tax=Rickenella mellea TaxID=50990 RepID=A0A4Y7PYD1_9AGAM|nr:hypothetical protein BD410DRAFT_391565 [Rickenella mellea]
MTAAASEVDSHMVHSECQVSPILRTPCEITSVIFQHCLPEDEFPQASVKSPPIGLSRVCSHWRKLAIGTPQLWSKILLCTSPHDSENILTDRMRSQGEALKVWMRRAAPFLLSVHLKYPTLPKFSDSTVSMKRLNHVLDFILENPTSWKSFRLSLPRGYLAYTWMTIQHNSPSLESFHIDDTSIPLFGPVDSDMPSFLTMDTAQTLSMLSARASIFYPPFNTTPFVRLRTLSLKHTGPYQCLQLLKYCPVVEDLNLSFYDLHDRAIPSENPTSPILLPRLRDFHLSHTGNSENGDSPFAAGGEIGQLLDKLDLPNLRWFYLWMTILGCARYSNHDLPWDYLLRLITGSNCSLDRLELRSPHIDTSSMLECLRFSPDLKYLGIPAHDKLEREVKELLPGLDSLRIFR